MENVKGVGGITPPPGEPPKTTEAPQGAPPQHMKDPFYRTILRLFGGDVGQTEAFWKFKQQSEFQLCMDQIKKSQRRALQAQKEAKNV